MKTILIVDDDVHIGDMLEEALSKERYLTRRAYSGTEAIMILENFRPDLVLLDLMLPGACGEEVLQKTGDIPVIVLSAKADPDSKVSLLLGGARDYVTKPFNLGELMARISVQLRGAPDASGGLCEFDGISLDSLNRTVSYHGEPVKLTRTEYAILKIMIQRPKQVFTKTQILDRISSDTPDCTDSSLKIHISNLRKKLREVSGKDYIEAVWGIGFKLEQGSKKQ